MIVSRSELRELRARRDSEVKYGSKQTFQTANQQGYQTQGSVSFNSNNRNNCSRALSELDSNTSIRKNNPKASSSANNFSYQSSYKPSQQQKRKQYPKMSFDIDLTRRNLKQFIIAMPNTINSHQIYSLNLAHNYIKQILPTLLLPFQSLAQLNLSSNLLDKLSFPYNKMQLKTLDIERNSLANLNLQHLPSLHSLNASHNKLIFITLPPSLKSLNLDHNSLSNMYFIQNCQQIHSISINFNFIYDFTFNSINQLDSITNKKTHLPRFLKLDKVECSHNKITHLNGLFNIKNVRELSLSFNQLSLSRENLNQLFHLENVQNLDLTENPLEGTYAISTTFQFLLQKLPKLQILNSEPKQVYEVEFRKRSEVNDEQDKEVHMNSQKNQEECWINNQSSIRENEKGLWDSEEKPFRLFMEEDHSPVSIAKETPKQYAAKSSKKNKSTKQWIYTLGESESKVEEDDSQIFKLMTLCNQEIKQQPFSTKNQQLKEDKPQTKEVAHKSSKKLLQLEQQVLNKNKQINISLSSIQFIQEKFEMDYQTKCILKIIFQMSFIPPAPLKHSSQTQIIAKRLNEDADQFVLFSKLFHKRKGILSLKKIHLIQETGSFFDWEQNHQQYQLTFFNHPQLQYYYTLMAHGDCLLTQVLKQKETLIEINHYLSPVPNSFGCYHIVVRNLKGSPKAFDKRHFAPVCYLVESKNI